MFVVVVLEHKISSRVFSWPFGDLIMPHGEKSARRCGHLLSLSLFRNDTRDVTRGSFEHGRETGQDAGPDALKPSDI